MWTRLHFKRTAVSSSVAENRNPPSPEMEITFSPGRTRQADPQRLLPVGHEDLPSTEAVQISCEPDVKGPHVQTQRHVLTKQLLEGSHQAHRMNRNTALIAGTFLKHHPVPDDLCQQSRICVEVVPVDKFRKLPDRRRNVPYQFQMGTVVPVDICTRDVDVNDVASAVSIPESGFVFNWVIPNRDHKIGGIEKLVRRLSTEKPNAPAEVIEVLTGNYPGPLICADHGDLCFLQ